MQERRVLLLQERCLETSGAGEVMTMVSAPQPAVPAQSASIVLILVHESPAMVGPR